MSVYFTCKQIAVPALRSEVCLLEECPQGVNAAAQEEEEEAQAVLVFQWLVLEEFAGCVCVTWLSAGNDQRLYQCYQAHADCAAD